MTSLEVVHVGHHLPYQCTVSSCPSFALDINLSNLTQSVSLGMLLQVPSMDLICISFQLLTYKNIQTSIFVCTLHYSLASLKSLEHEKKEEEEEEDNTEMALTCFNFCMLDNVDDTCIDILLLPSTKN